MHGWKKGSELAKEQITVERGDIVLDETKTVVDTSLYWTATLYGPLSTGEHVHISRTGERSQDALLALRSAIEQEGWLIVD